MPPLPLSDAGGISLLEDGDGLPVDGKDPVRSLDCAVDLAVGGIIQEHIDHIVEVSEGVTDGKSIHSERASTAQSIHSYLHHHVSGRSLAPHKEMCLSREWRDREQGACL